MELDERDRSEPDNLLCQTPDCPGALTPATETPATEDTHHRCGECLLCGQHKILLPATHALLTDAFIRIALEVVRSND